MKLSPSDVARLDPYQFMGVLGKRVIHPGGRASTRALYRMADLREGQRVLEVGCGAGTTAVEMAREFGVHVTAVDVDPVMLERTRATVKAADVGSLVSVQEASIEDLPFPDGSFDRVVVEAVTMFVERPRAAAEVARVTRAGGRVLEHEFIWRKEPSARARHAMHDVVCPGVQFEGPADWTRLYEDAGLVPGEVVTGPFAMMTPAGFLRDEGLWNSFAILGRMMTRWAYLRRMGWLMRHMATVMPSLGYVVLSADKPAARAPALPGAG